MSDSNQFVALKFSAGFAQYAECMLGKTDDPLRLTGTIMDEFVEQQIRTRDDSNRNKLFLLTHHYARMLLLYVMNEFEKANDQHERFVSWYALESGPLFIKKFSFFISTLNCYATARSNKAKSRCMLKKAQECISFLQPLEKAGAPMVAHMMSLIEAERLVTCQGNTPDDHVLCFFDKAIASAEEGQFYVSAAIACERASEYLASIGNKRVSREYLLRSYQAYIDYGAVAKLNQLKASYDILEDWHTQSPSNTILQTKVHPHLFVS